MEMTKELMAKVVEIVNAAYWDDVFINERQCLYGNICGHWARYQQPQEEKVVEKWLDGVVAEWPEVRRLPSGEPDLENPVNSWRDRQEEEHCNMIWANERRLALLRFVLERAKAQLSGLG